MKSMQWVGWDQTEHLLAKSAVMSVTHPIQVHIRRKRNISFDFSRLVSIPSRMIASQVCLGTGPAAPGAGLARPGQGPDVFHYSLIGRSHNSIVQGTLHDG